MGVIILSGVTIGNGAILGAYSVVRRDVRPYAIAIGNPAQESRRRFSDEQIEALEAIAWWDWPWDRIRESVPKLSNGDIEDFLSSCEAGT
jgi:carbonic anhydrase/acetyltransferase-like protein (isoleucine patch superfamily)